MPRVTKKAWFGPKRLIGSGWSPYSWQGWLVQVAFLLLLIAAAVTLRGSTRILAVIALFAIYGTLVFLTGDWPGRAGGTGRE